MNSIHNLQKNFVIFKTDSWKVNIEVFFQSNTLRLTQKKMSELFEIDRTVVTKHLKNIFESDELDENAVCAKIAHTASDNKTYSIKHYNLKAIIAVWFRINSHRAIEFRKRATKVLHSYIIKWFAMDDERLKDMGHFWQEYFDELLERIREIRLSERRFYQKITDIYTLSSDYDAKAPSTQEFFATIQNKLHRAISGKTAAEIIYNEADAKKVHMWLKTRKKAPNGKILKSDVTIAKNYLNQEHITQLQRIVSAYLDLAEDRTKRNIVMNMKDRASFLDKFLDISDYPILTNPWKIWALEAKIKAEWEFEKFRVKQDKEFISDFDKYIQQYIEN